MSSPTHRLLPSLLLLLASGCLLDRDLYELRRRQLGASDAGVGSDVDLDGDGFDGDDCNDADASVFPGAVEEPYDGVDQDCDGSDLTDADGDGFDAAFVGGRDCDDDDPDIHPDAIERWADALHDNDCDGELTTEPVEWLQDPLLGPAEEAHLGRAVEPWVRSDGTGLGIIAGLPLYDVDASGGGAVFVWYSDLDSMHTIVGSAANGFLGVAVGVARGATGDGTADLLMSATGVFGGTGAVYVVSEATILGADSTVLPGDEFTSLHGDEPGGYFGSALCQVGDVDADGWSDIAVSAPYAAVGGAAEAGMLGLWAVPVLSSGGSASFDDATATLEGAVAGTHLGNSVSGLGDVDGDGYDDVLVTGDAGPVATVFSGAPSGLSDESTALLLYGNGGIGHERGRVVPVGDINGDERTDIAFLDEDYVEVFTSLAGSATAVVGSGHARILVEPGEFGSYVFDVEGVPDADGDGLGEVIVPVAKYGPANYGSAVGVFPGSALSFGETIAFSDAPATLFVQRFDANTGYSASIAPDLDGDGHSELLLGAPDDAQAGAGAGAIAVIPVPR